MKSFGGTLGYMGIKDVELMGFKFWLRVFFERKKEVLRS